MDPSKEENLKPPSIFFFFSEVEKMEIQEPKILRKFGWLSKWKRKERLFQREYVLVWR